MKKNDILNWLLEGDVSIRYQTFRDLLGKEKPGLQRRIAKEGWGLKYISKRNPDGHWGQRYYQPKWTSTHYTVLDLRNLNIHPSDVDISQIINELLDNKGSDGGIYPIGRHKITDVCLNGMFLYYACYFGVREKKIKSVVDCLLNEQMQDGGFNCHSNTVGAKHSSLHTTLSVCEGILEYRKNGFKYRTKELKIAEEESRKFILQHKLYKSHRTGETISRRMTALHYPPRWHYDILRALDYFRSAGCKYDNRMDDAINVLLKKRRKNNTWPLQAHHPGQRHFDMEIVGKPGRWNTLRALRVLKHFGIQD
jgi:hypothetical protein